MRIAVVVGALLGLVSACKKNEAAAPSTGSGSSVVVAPADAQVAAAPASAALVMENVLEEQDPHLLAAFGKQMPTLPAINADGTVIATLEPTGDPQTYPMPLQVTIATLPSDETLEELPILTDEEASNLSEKERETWVTPDLAKQLAARGKAIMSKLQGFHSLVLVAAADSADYAKKPTKIGDLTLTAQESDDGLVVTLESAQLKTIHKARFDNFREGPECYFRPGLDSVYTDPAKPSALYLEVSPRYKSGCDDKPRELIVWSTDPSSTTPEERIASLVEEQLDIVGVNNTESPLPRTRPSSAATWSDRSTT